MYHEHSETHAPGQPCQICPPRPPGEDGSGGGAPRSFSARAQCCLLLAAVPNSTGESRLSFTNALFPSPPSLSMGVQEAFLFPARVGNSCQ